MDIKSRKRINWAKDKALKMMDYVVECCAARDFVEVTGHMGGDVVTFRVYDDGNMYER